MNTSAVFSPCFLRSDIEKTPPFDHFADKQRKTWFTSFIVSRLSERKQSIPTWILIVVLACFATGASASAVVYDFDRVTTGALSPQDNWKPFSNYPEDAAAATTVATSPMGNVVQKEGGWWGGNSFQIRPNNGGPNNSGFSIPTVGGTTTKVILQFASFTQYDAREWLASGFTVAYNPASNISLSPRNNTLLGPMVIRQRYTVGFREAGNGPAHLINVAAIGDNPAEVRLVMDITLDNGGGRGSIFYRTTIGSGDWTAVEGLQNIPLGLKPGVANGLNPTKWNSLVVMNSYPERAGSTHLTVETISEAPQAQALIGFDGTGSEFSANFTEQGNTAGTQFTFNAMGGINNAGRINVAGNHDTLVYKTPMAGFAAPDSGYTVSAFYKARANGGTGGDLSIATGLLSAPSTKLGSGSGAYLMAQISATYTVAPALTKFQISVRSYSGSGRFTLTDPRPFTLITGNWYKLTTVYKILAPSDPSIVPDKFVASVTVDDYGPTGTSVPSTVITWTSAPLTNSYFAGASSLWSAVMTGAPTGATGRGASSLDQFAIGLYPDAAVASRRFPDGSVVNVKMPPYNALGDGVNDDTDEIQKAINDHKGIIYFPNGTYKVSKTLFYKDAAGNWDNNRKLQGESRNGTIIKLTDNNPAFGDSVNPQAVIYTASNPSDPKSGAGTDAFRNSISNLTVDVGSGNPGATGIDYIASNVGTIRDVLVRSSDPALRGKYGIAMNRSAVGPCLLKNIEIRGFEDGINSGSSYMIVTIENLTLSGQSFAGIHAAQTGLSIRRLTSTNTVPAILDEVIAGLIVVDQAELHGGAAGRYAIESKGNLFLRDIHTSGYRSSDSRNTSILSRGTAYGGVPSTVPSGFYFTEFTNQPKQSLPATPLLASLRLPVEETPVSWDNNPGNWVSVGAPNGDDDTARIQSAIDNAPVGKNTLYFPYGVYKVSNTIDLGKNIRHVVGLLSTISLAGPSPDRINYFLESGPPKPVFRINAPANHLSFTLIEDLAIGMSGVQAVAFEGTSTKPMTIQSTIPWINGGGYRNTDIWRLGKLFLEDFSPSGHNGSRVYLNYPQKVWARQLNVESGAGPGVNNVGGDLWVLGFKTEDGGPFINTSNMGQSEVLGAFHYITQDIPAGEAAYTSVDSKVSLSFATNLGQYQDGSWKKDYTVWLRRIEGAAVTDFLRAQTYGRWGANSNRQRVVPLLTSH